MNNHKLKTTPTVNLITLLEQEEIKKDQALTNIVVFELASRIYVPNDETTFDDLLGQLGYKEVEEVKIHTRKPQRYGDIST